MAFSRVILPSLNDCNLKCYDEIIDSCVRICNANVCNLPHVQPCKKIYAVSKDYELTYPDLSRNRPNIINNNLTM